MNVGTKSVLFGVHAFWWHPFTVAFAWRKLYGAWPDRFQWCAIFCHDLGYWGCPNMDGIEGRRHPIAGAAWAQKLAGRVARWSGYNRVHQLTTALDIYFLSLLHSREFSKETNVEPSELCWADKYCCFYDPAWFYLLRGHLSGEIYEFRANAAGHIPDGYSLRQWYLWYRNKVRNLPEIARLLPPSRSCVFPF